MPKSNVQTTKPITITGKAPASKPKQAIKFDKNFGATDVGGPSMHGMGACEGKTLSSYDSGDHGHNDHGSKSY